MTVMGVMEVIVDKVVNVIAVRHGFMSAIGTMDVIGVMSVADVGRRAVIGVGCTDVDHVLVHVTVMGVMKVPVVQVINVITMTDGRVTTVATMLVFVVASVFIGIAHNRASSSPHCRDVVSHIAHNKLRQTAVALQALSPR